jgi:uncharacterized membrane protein
MYRKIVIILFVLLFPIFPKNIFAQTGEKIDDYQANIIIQQTGEIYVREEIIYNFGSTQKHGIFRKIPYLKTNTEGKKYQLEFYQFSVTGNNGGKYLFSESKENGDLILKIGDPDTYISGIQRYIITYQVRGAITYFSDHDELYWNVIGNSWQVPIDKAQVSVSFSVSDKMPQNDIKYKCFIGSLGSTDNCQIMLNENNYIRSVVQNLNPYQGLTVVIGFPKGTVAVIEPQLVVSYWETMQGRALMILLIILAIFWYFVLPFWIIFKWYKYGRDPNVGPALTVYYDPPKSQAGRILTPAETGGLIDENVDFKEFVATIIDLAKRGHFKIIEEKKQEFVLLKSKTAINNDKLTNVESNLIKDLFGGGSKIKLKEPSVLTSFENFKSELYQLLVDDNFFVKNPQSTREKYYILAALGFLTANILLLVFAGFFGKNMPSKTLFGAGEAGKAKGLRNFLKSQEAHFEYLKKFDNEYKLGKQFIFEKFLAFAIVFGVEKEWADKFQDILLKQPDWYQSNHITNFNSIVFANSISKSFSSGFYQPTTTHSTSGFSSGFSSGGGFSGGGGGGGGGGSW